MEAFYDSDEDIAWGPVTINEIKRDLTRQNSSSISRRKTFSNFTATMDDSSDSKRLPYKEQLNTKQVPTDIPELLKKTVEHLTSTAEIQAENPTNFVDKVSKILNETPSEYKTASTTLSNSIYGTAFNSFAKPDTSAPLQQNAYLGFTSISSHSRPSTWVINESPALVENTIILSSDDEEQASFEEQIDDIIDLLDEDILNDTSNEQNHKIVDCHENLFMKAKERSDRKGDLFTKNCFSKIQENPFTNSSLPENPVTAKSLDVKQSEDEEETNSSDFLTAANESEGSYVRYGYGNIPKASKPEGDFEISSPREKKNLFEKLQSENYPYQIDGRFRVESALDLSHEYNNELESNCELESRNKCNYEEASTRENERDIEKEYKQDIEEEYKQDIEEEYKQDIEEEYEQDIEEEYEQDIEEEYEQDIEKEYEQDIKEKYEQDIEKEYEQDIKEKYEQDIEEEYEQDIEEEYEQDIEKEYEQDIKEKYEQDIEKEYDEDSSGKFSSYDLEDKQNTSETEGNELEVNELEVMPKNTDLRFNDTLEEMELLLQKGLDYNLPGDTSNCSNSTSNSSYPKSNSSYPKSNSSCSKLNSNYDLKNNYYCNYNENYTTLKPFDSPNRNNTPKTLSPIESNYKNFSKIPKRLEPAEFPRTPKHLNNFKVPLQPLQKKSALFNTPEIKSSATKGLTVKSTFVNVVSPVRLYIKNSTTPLKASGLPKLLPQQKLEKAECEKENVNFPEVIYKPSKQTIVKKNDLQLQNIKQLPQSHYIIKHERIIREKPNSNIQDRLQKNDITINVEDSTNDISVLTMSENVIR